MCDTSFIPLLWCSVSISLGASREDHGSPSTPTFLRTFSVLSGECAVFRTQAQNRPTLKLSSRQSIGLVTELLLRPAFLCLTVGLAYWGGTSLKLQRENKLAVNLFMDHRSWCKFLNKVIFKHILVLRTIVLTYWEGNRLIEVSLCWRWKCPCWWEPMKYPTIL